jgi:hypothetical protein
MRLVSHLDPTAVSPHPIRMSMRLKGGRWIHSSHFVSTLRLVCSSSA